MARVVIDGREMDAEEGTTVLMTAEKAGIEIPHMCYDPELEPYGSCRLCIVRANGKLATACSFKVSDGLKVETADREISDMRKTALELMLSDHYGDCIGPCKDGCPAHSDVQGYLALIAMGRYHEAVKLMKESYILPAVLGRVCPAFCEKKCRRNLVDEPLAIRALKRFAADEDLKDPWMPEIGEERKERIAVIGSGPAGLACAYYLRTKGYSVTVFERMEKLGGMLRYGIPEYRLPRDVLDRDIETVIKTGIEVRTGVEGVSVEELKEEYDAVFVATGAWKSTQMGIEGESLAMSGIDFLRKVNTGERPDIGKKVIVVGGGNTAIDAARTALRLGSEVTVVYRRSRAEMPANEEEVREAEEEGVHFEFLVNPVKMHEEERIEVELIRMELGAPDASGRRRPVPVEGSNFVMEADSVILALGQYSDDALLKSAGIMVEKGRAIVDDITLETGVAGVFCGGDIVLGPSTVIESIASGRKAAAMIDLYLKGKLEKAREILASGHSDDGDLHEILSEFGEYNHWKDVTREDYANIERIPRAEIRLRDAGDRKKDFNEVELALAEDDVSKEALRCMSCGCTKAFTCALREYSTLYGAKQLPGEKRRFDLDDSHKNITLDNNKCVLCGRCVNLVQEITGEGFLDYMSRGFLTKISFPPGSKFADCRGQMLGDCIDVCPTGAITEKLPFIKQGPWKGKSIPTVCNGCGLGCEMNIEAYDGMLLRASSKLPSWNNGHVCDVARFGRPWEERIEKPLFKGRKITTKKAMSIVREHMEAIILTPEVTQEEALSFRDFAERHNMKLGALVHEGISTASYEDLLRAKRVLLKADLEKYPVMKILLRGKELVDRDYDLAILEAPAEPLKAPTMILHEGVNEAGLLKLGIGGMPESDSYLVVGNLKQKLSGFVMVLGKSDTAELQLPYPSWAEREGTIINSANMELRVNRAKPSVHGFPLEDL